MWGEIDTSRMSIGQTDRLTAAMDPFGISIFLTVGIDDEREEEVITQNTNSTTMLKHNYIIT